MNSPSIQLETSNGKDDGNGGGNGSGNGSGSGDGNGGENSGNYSTSNSMWNSNLGMHFNGSAMFQAPQWYNEHQHQQQQQEQDQQQYKYYPYNHFPPMQQHPLVYEFRNSKMTEYNNSQLHKKSYNNNNKNHNNYKNNSNKHNKNNNNNSNADGHNGGMYSPKPKHVQSNGNGGVHSFAPKLYNSNLQRGKFKNLNENGYFNHARRGEEARKYANAKISDFKGKIADLCTDQYGCRFLQRVLIDDEDEDENENENDEDENDEDENDGKQNILSDNKHELVATVIFDEIYPSIAKLMMDPFGNYLVQRLVEDLNKEQIKVLWEQICSDFFQILCNRHGSRALQTIIGYVAPNDKEIKEMIIGSISSRIVQLMCDVNGMHIVNKLVQVFGQRGKGDGEDGELLQEELDNQFIYNECLLNCEMLACHKQGCCVLQRCLEHGSIKQVVELCHEITMHVSRLVVDPYGNYVLQYVLLVGGGCDADADADAESQSLILDYLKENLYVLSTDRFGSNVIEQSLKMKEKGGNDGVLAVNSRMETQEALSIKDGMILSLLELSSEKFVKLLNDLYGNYVIQSSLDVANELDLKKLQELLVPLLPEIRNTPHGKRILSKLSEK